MPEIKKYLSRDGLEEYNSLLPHSSAEMQTYVNEWLDEHPEATTTVQDGAITEPKLADKSVSLRTLADDTVHMLKGAILTGNLSGEVLTADDAYSAPPVSLTVDGKSTQDGTPTPDAPVEIVSVEQANLIFAGRNLLDLNFVDQYTVASGGSRFTANGDGTFTVEAIADSGGSKTVGLIKGTGFRHVNVNYPIDLPSTIANGAFQLPAGTYTFKSYSSNNATEVYLRIRHGAYNATTEGRDNVTFTTDGTEWCQMFIYVQSFSTLLANGPVTLSGQLEVGSTATAYQPYDGTNVLLNLAQALRSLPDGTHDTLSFAYLRPSTREGWAWYTPTLTANVGHAVLDGSESWAKADSRNRMYTSRNDMLRATNYEQRMLCTTLRVYPYNQSVSSSVPGISGWSGGRYPGQNWFYVGADGITTAAEIKQWLADNPAEVLYELVTPTVTTLDPIELPVLPAPECTVWSDPSTGLAMEYVRDANIVIQNIEQAIADS